MSIPTVIQDVRARKIFDSRGNPTIEVDIVTQNGFGRAAAPAGASKGKWEVQSYPSGGVDQAVKKVNETVAPKLIGMDADEQETIDTVLHEIDATDNFSKIGGNTAYAVSVATSLAAASSKDIPLFQHLSGTFTCEIPFPLGNVIGGGMHARGRRTDIQEFLVLSTKASTAVEASEANIRVHAEVPNLISKFGATVGGKGDEGAWVSDLETHKALELLSEACEVVLDDVGVEVRLGLDVAASTLWDPKKKAYVYERDERRLEEEKQIDFILDLIEDYNLIYVEDPLREDAFEAFGELTKRAKGCLVCGDDLFTTNIKRLETGLKHNAANATIIKPNQVGTLTDAYKAARRAKLAGYVPVMSHRSGDVPEPVLAHLAVAFQCPIIKTGVVGGERVAKINELFRIQEALGNRAKMASIKV